MGMALKEGEKKNPPTFIIRSTTNLLYIRLAATVGGYALVVVARLYVLLVVQVQS